MSLQDVLLSTQIKVRHPSKSLKIENKDIYDFDDKTKDSESLNPPPVNPLNNSRDYIQELKDKLIKRQIARWLNSKNENKSYFSATEISECPKQTWFKLKGKITYEMLDIDKFFYLLDIYGRMGDAVHKYIYDTLNFDSKEVYIKDEENHVSGRYDIYDGQNIIDIKSSLNITDCSKQLSIYYYLISVYKKLPVKSVKVWWVLKDKMVEYEIDKLKEVYPMLLNRAKKLYTALKEETFPESLGIDTDSCKYCPIESWCNGRIPTQSKETIEKNSRTNIDNEKKDDILFLL